MILASRPLGEGAEGRRLRNSTCTSRPSPRLSGRLAEGRPPGLKIVPQTTLVAV